MGKVYVVFKGRRPGVYNTWMECDAQVCGYRGNVHKSFANKKEGEKALARYTAAKMKKQLPPGKQDAPEKQDEKRVWGETAQQAQMKAIDGMNV